MNVRRLQTIGDLKRALDHYPEQAKILFATPFEEDDFTDFIATLDISESFEKDPFGRPCDVMIHLVCADVAEDDDQLDELDRRQRRRGTVH